MVNITEKAKDKSEVGGEDNEIPVLEDQLKEDQKKEWEEYLEKFKREALKSFSINRSGEVIKKFDFPQFGSFTETQRKNKMIDAVGQAVAQAFIQSATVMGNTVHNAMVKTFTEGTFPGTMVPCYIQPNQMQYVPLEVSVAAALSASNSQARTSNSQTIPQSTIAATEIKTDPVYSATRPITTSVQDGSRLRFLKGGILILSLAWIQVSLRHPRGSSTHRLHSR